MIRLIYFSQKHHVMLYLSLKHGSERDSKTETDKILLLRTHDIIQLFLKRNILGMASKRFLHKCPVRR